MEVRKIVITGGPSTGKTALIEYLEKNGHTCYHEIIRTMTLEAKKEIDPKSLGSNPLAFVKDPQRFNQKLLEGRTQQFLDAQKKRNTPIFFDRGIPDVLAYMDFFKQPYPPAYEKTCITYKYDRVIILPPWREIFISDGERMESYEEAVVLYDHLRETYTRLGYDLVSLPKGSLEERMNHIYMIIKEL